MKCSIGADPDNPRGATETLAEAARYVVRSFSKHFLEWDNTFAYYAVVFAQGRRGAGVSISDQRLIRLRVLLLGLKCGRWLRFGYRFGYRIRKSPPRLTKRLSARRI